MLAIPGIPGGGTPGTPDTDVKVVGMRTRKTRRRTTVFKALANESRCKIVEILAEEGEKCVCELVDRLGLDQSTVSKHLGVLRNADIVSFRKEGLNVWYSLHATCTYQFMKCIDRMCESGTGVELAGCQGQQEGHSDAGCQMELASGSNASGSNASGHNASGPDAGGTDRRDPEGRA